VLSPQYAFASESKACIRENEEEVDSIAILGQELPYYNAKIDMQNFSSIMHRAAAWRELGILMHVRVTLSRLYGSRISGTLEYKVGIRCILLKTAKIHAT